MYIHKLSQGLYSLSDKTSYQQFSSSLEAAWLDVIMIYRYEIWQASQQRCCLGVCSISKRLKTYKSSRLRDFARSCGNTSARLGNRGPDIEPLWCKYTALPISRGCFSPNNSRQTPKVHPFGWCIGVFREFEVWSKLLCWVQCRGILYRDISWVYSTRSTITGLWMTWWSKAPGDQ